MAEAVERVPAKNRWAIATQSLTGPVMAGNKALLDVARRETYDGILGQLCVARQRRKVKGGEGTGRRICA